MPLTTIPLFPEAAYQYSLNLDGTTKAFSFSVNRREGAIHMDVEEAGVPLRTGIRLLPHTPVRVPGISGFFVLLPNHIDQNFESISSILFLSTYYELIHISTP